MTCVQFGLQHRACNYHAFSNSPAGYCLHGCYVNFVLKREQGPRITVSVAANSRNDKNPPMVDGGSDNTRPD